MFFFKTKPIVTPMPSDPPTLPLWREVSEKYTVGRHFHHLRQLHAVVRVEPPVWFRDIDNGSWRQAGGYICTEFQPKTNVKQRTWGQDTFEYLLYIAKKP